MEEYYWKVVKGGKDKKGVKFPNPKFGTSYIRGLQRPNWDLVSPWLALSGAESELSVLMRSLDLTYLT